VAVRSHCSQRRKAHGIAEYVSGCWRSQRSSLQEECCRKRSKHGCVRHLQTDSSKGDPPWELADNGQVPEVMQMSKAKEKWTDGNNHAAIPALLQQ
jgi:hypothetical protein